ncbi:MAG: ATP-dependent RNA helicase HrpA [Pseudonocardia sp.]|nr:ATP-dependent RNA helicase HrpA [Pseudonocardia sp.]
MRISYPPDLPITARRDDIAAAIRDHQVVVLAGETGSGKTTQLPKICLELGRGGAGKIGHTQPRRLAARTVAARIASELDTELGTTVGWKVRFTDQVSEQTRVKLMTDGILLAELAGDRMLRQYDTLIIDEAHERSLNIDFILGYLKQLLPRRPDLKLIITSATIDPERFAQHFGTPGKPAPIIEVSGRTYPVEVRYRPLTDPDEPDAQERDQPEAIVDAVRELVAEGPGDVLVFLPGERDIRDTTDALAEAMTHGQLPKLELLPLFARLSTAEQQRVFSPGAALGRRVVLATNVAETSLTVPGIKYVVDPGLARMSRYSHRTKVQRLPIEKISQASANQRAGRCGRTSDGICIRLYSLDDFEGRPEFTEPEILRTNLASVVLRMIALGFGEVADFPFLDPPDRRAITDGIHLLNELGALTSANGERKLTETGRSLERLPIEPRFARMLLEAGRNGCVAEALVIVAGLSIQDPRDRPVDATEAADTAHARFVDPRSDFVSYLNLWRYLDERRQELTGSQFRRLCRAEFLHYLRVREWQDLHGQLRQTLRELDITPNREPADPRVVHQSLLAGLLSHIGLRLEPKPDGRRRPDLNNYLGARGASFAIFPGSALFRRPPRWVMAAELVETSRLWARTVARIEPEWIEPLATHLVRSTFSEPHWSAQRGTVMAHERVTLYGVPIVADRLVNYAGVDPELSRELFIRHALVEGDWRTQHEFPRHNRELLDQVDEWEQRARRRDIMVDEQALFEFYDKQVPANVVSARQFDRWWKRASRETPTLLNMSLAELTTGAAGMSESRYPSFWSTSTPGMSAQPAPRLALHYEFEPGSASDGVSVDIPVGLLAQVDEDAFSWQIPGHREELVTALIRSLRKDLRRNFVPVPDTVHAALARLRPEHGSLLDELSRVLRELTGVSVPRDAWRLDKVPDHLRINFRVLDADGTVLGAGKDLEALRQQLVSRTRAAVAATAPELERTGLRSWEGLPASLPRSVRREHDGYVVTGYPALVDAGTAVDVRVLSTPDEQRDAMRAGTRRLLVLTVPSPGRQVRRTLRGADALVLSQGPHGSLDALLDDCLQCAVDALLAATGGPAWDAAGFDALRSSVASGLTAMLVDVVARVVDVLRAATEVRSRLANLPHLSPGLAASVADVRAQLAGLVYPGFVLATGAARLADVARYLRGASRRLERLPHQPERDRDWMARVHEVQQAYDELLASLPPGRALPDTVAEIRWMIEELRVSFFAQGLGTRYTISEKRIYRAIDDLLP